jgi:hypothetical protein
MRIKNAIVFAILMQNNNGIIEKSPAYVSEKLRMCERMEDSSGLLDDTNMKIYNQYLGLWGSQDVD